MPALIADEELDAAYSQKNIMNARMDETWNFGDSKEGLIHRIHSYPAKFPAFITTRALQYAERNGVKVETVADVFCGCGTTAVEAKKNGKNFWGCDINPVATLIARVKTRHYSDITLERYFSAVKNRFYSVKITEEDYEGISERIKYWFEEENIECLLKLKKAIKIEVSDQSPYQSFFFCAFSNILKPTSRWLTKSIKAQIDPHKSPRGVMDAFEDQFALMRKANRENIFPSNGNKVRIFRRNFLSIRPQKPLADLIVTSPPYVVSYDYASIHQLSALWLDFAHDYRDLRKNMIGNEYGVSPLSVSDIDKLLESGRETYRNLFHADKQKAISVARYFLDMEKTVKKSHVILNRNGLAFFVIGNTQYKNTGINNAGYLAECMEKSNFRNIEIIKRKISSKTMTPYRDSRGRFTRDSTKRKVYNEEFIVTGRKK